MTIRVDDELARLVDETARADGGSRADVIDAALRREVRRRYAEHDAEIDAASTDADPESDAYGNWAAHNADQVWSGLD